MGGAPTPKWDPIGVDPQPYMERTKKTCGQKILVHHFDPKSQKAQASLEHIGLAKQRVGPLKNIYLILAKERIVLGFWFRFRKKQQTSTHDLRSTEIGRKPASAKLSFSLGSVAWSGRLRRL